MRKAIILFPAMLLAGCASLQAAKVYLPSDIAASGSWIPITGIGGGTHGRFAVGDYRGGFERSERQLSFFGSDIRNYGHADFVISGPEIGTTIEGMCRMRERLLDFGIVELKPQRMAFRCNFTAGERAFPARIELQETVGEMGGALGRHERRGEIALGGETIHFRSVHELTGSSLDVAQPMGYAFRQDDRPIGALELNGTPRFFVRDDLASGVLRTMTIAAVALSIFWDPSNSALGD